jgi:hypothetical protein
MYQSCKLSPTATITIAAFPPSQRGNSHKKDTVANPIQHIYNDKSAAAVSQTNMPGVEQFSRGHGWYMMATHTQAKATQSPAPVSRVLKDPPPGTLSDTLFQPMSTVPSGDWLCPACDPVYRIKDELFDPNTPLSYRPGDPYTNSFLLV